MAPKAPRARPAIDRTGIEHLRRVTYPALVSGPVDFLDGIAARLTGAGVQRAVAERNTAPIYDWLMTLVSLQGISDGVALGWDARHGGIAWAEVNSALAAKPSCPRLRSYGPTGVSRLLLSEGTRDLCRARASARMSAAAARSPERRAQCRRLRHRAIHPRSVRRRLCRLARCEPHPRRSRARQCQPCRKARDRRGEAVDGHRRHRAVAWSLMLAELLLVAILVASDG